MMLNYLMGTLSLFLLYKNEIQVFFLIQYFQVYLPDL